MVFGSCAYKRNGKGKKRSSRYFRKTIKRSGHLEGSGLHSGEKMKIIFHPAETGKGLWFYRKNGAEKYLLAHVDNVIDTSLATTLGNRSFHIQTVEHLMYAIYCLGITDMIIEIQGGLEVPILDGSAEVFFTTLKELGTHKFCEERQPLVITRPISVTDGDRYIVGMPSQGLRISYSIDYPHPLLKKQFLEIDFENPKKQKKVAKARTFGFLYEIEKLRAKGLALGGSPINVLIYSKEKTINPPKFNQESLHHKVLDLVGDLALTTQPIVGHILGSKGGHALDVAFGRKLIKNFGLPNKNLNSTPFLKELMPSYSARAWFQKAFLQKAPSLL